MYVRLQVGERWYVRPCSLGRSWYARFQVWKKGRKEPISKELNFQQNTERKNNKKGSLTDKNLGEKVEKDKIDIFDIFKTQKKENIRRKVKVKLRCNIQQKGKAV